MPKRTSEEISFDDRNDRRWQSNVMRKSDRIPRYASFYQRYQGKGPGEFRSLKVGFRENLQSVCRHSNDTGILVGEFFPNCLESRPMFILPPYHLKDVLILKADSPSTGSGFEWNSKVMGADDLPSFEGG
ncbi:MAG: hypothetical protein ACKVGW_13035 [Verrucomicrobiia bacterium]